jgi:hypothetical protein
VKSAIHGRQIIHILPPFSPDVKSGDPDNFGALSPYIVYYYGHPGNFPAQADFFPAQADFFPAQADFLPAQADFFPAQADFFPAQADFFPAQADFFPA